MNALLTGGSRGIGHALANALTEDGWTVLAPTRDEIDLSSQYAALRLDDWLSSRTKSLEAIICCHASYGPLIEAWNASTVAMMDPMIVNYGGTHAAIHGARTYLHTGSRIITFGGGGDGPNVRCSAYGASKAAILRLTEALAHELKDQGILVNAVLPGPVSTGSQQRFVDAGLSLKGDSPKAVIKLVRWLLSPASDGITGRAISCRYDFFETWPKRPFMNPDTATMRRVRDE